MVAAHQGEQPGQKTEEERDDHHHRGIEKGIIGEEEEEHGSGREEDGNPLQHPGNFQTAGTTGAAADGRRKSGEAAGVGQSGRVAGLILGDLFQFFIATAGEKF